MEITAHFLSPLLQKEATACVRTRRPVKEFFMNRFHLFVSASALLVLSAGTSVYAAGPAVEGTPVPMQAKPDLSTMNFLIGTWTCTDLSSRRPGPFTITEVYSKDPGGYWIIRESTIHKASWIPREFHSETKYTYDSVAKRWVRITTGEQGGYSVSTAPMPVGKTKTYTSVIQAKSTDVSSYAPEVYTKVSDTKKTMATSFTETSGRVVTVKETCTKS
jgi:hypothetical protein